MSEFSDRLISLRESKGWSKTYVAKMIGLTSMQTYANYEYGRREPDLATVNKLANLFNVSIDSLLGRKPSEDEQLDLTLDEAVDSVMSYNGQAVTPHDRKMMKNLWKTYLSNKE